MQGHPQFIGLPYFCGMEEADLNLLKQLVNIHAPSGEEYAMQQFLIRWFKENKSEFASPPELIYGEDFQDCLIVVFGQPKLAVFAHMDSVGYTAGYQNELIKIGGPKAEGGTLLTGEDRLGKIEGKLHYAIEDDGDEQRIVKTMVEFEREIERGTTLTYKPHTDLQDKLLTSTYLDNRLGVLNALKLAFHAENLALVFSCWEETGGGSVGYLSRYLYDKYRIRQALISDITWVTEGVKAGKGVAISLRDSGIPRRSYIKKIVRLAEGSGIPYQLEVESSGGSDGNALQRAPYPFDWCFIGAAEDHVHQPNEQVHVDDAAAMFNMYQYLVRELSP